MFDDLLKPSRLWTRTEILSRPCPVPKAPGVYAWYFRSLYGVPTTGCFNCGEYKLLYVGIAPTKTPTNGKLPSRHTLYHRLRDHMQGNAEGSTLRLSLGSILADELGIELRRVGSGKRLTFSTGEAVLSKWLEVNARVVWHACESPWKLEEELIRRLNLPLNLEMNDANPFYPALKELRRAAKAKARTLPVLTW